MPHREKPGVDPDRLRMMAKRASDLHLGGGVPMTDAVVQVVRDEPGVGPEHVRRVVTFANNDTFQRMFRKQAGDHRVINFRLADPSDVLKELNMGATPAPTAVSEHSKMASYFPGSDSIENIFQPTKTAAEDIPNPINELWRTRQRVDGLLDHARSEFMGASARYDDAVRSMCKVARDAVLEGASTADINRAISFYSDSNDMTKLALGLIQRSFEGGDVAPQRDAMLSKSASAVPHPQHPLVESFKTFAKVAMARFRYAAAIDTLTEELRKVDAAVKRHL